MNTYLMNIVFFLPNLCMQVQGQIPTDYEPGHPLCRVGDRPAINQTQVKCDTDTTSATYLHLTRNCRTRCSNCYNISELVFPTYGCLVSSKCTCLASAQQQQPQPTVETLLPFMPVLGNGLGGVAPDNGNSTSFYAPGNGNYNISSTNHGSTGSHPQNISISLVLTLNVATGK